MMFYMMFANYSNLRELWTDLKRLRISRLHDNVLRLVQELEEQIVPPARPTRIMSRYERQAAIEHCLDVCESQIRRANNRSDDVTVRMFQKLEKRVKLVRADWEIINAAASS